MRHDSRVAIGPSFPRILLMSTCLGETMNSTPFYSSESLDLDDQLYGYHNQSQNEQPFTIGIWFWTFIGLPGETYMVYTGKMALSSLCLSQS